MTCVQHYHSSRQQQTSKRSKYTHIRNSSFQETIRCCLTLPVRCTTDPSNSISTRSSGSLPLELFCVVVTISAQLTDCVKCASIALSKGKKNADYINCNSFSSYMPWKGIMCKWTSLWNQLWECQFQDGDRWICSASGCSGNLHSNV